MSVHKKKITPKVYFLLILMFFFICRQFVTEGLRIYELATNKMEQCLDISIEDSCSLETKVVSLEEVEKYFTTSLFKRLTIEFIPCKEAISFTSNIHEVYLGLNTPPPEHSNLLA